MSEFERTCRRCGHGSDWHSFKDEVNEPLGLDVTSLDAVFSCNGPGLTGCTCPTFVEPDAEVTS